MDNDGVIFVILLNAEKYLTLCVNFGSKRHENFSKGQVVKGWEWSRHVSDMIVLSRDDGAKEARLFVHKASSYVPGFGCDREVGVSCVGDEPEVDT